MSYRAVACWTQNCNLDDSGWGVLMQPSAWYRPQVDATQLDLAVAPPVVAWDSVVHGYRVSIVLATEPKAPAYIVYKDGVPELDSLFVSLRQDFCDVGVLCVLDNVSLAHEQQNFSYTVATCYSDCDPLSAKTSFARVSLPSQPVVVPVRSS